MIGFRLIKLALTIYTNSVGQTDLFVLSVRVVKHGK